MLAPSESLQVKDCVLKVDLMQVASMTEALSSHFELTVKIGEEVVLQQSLPLRLLPFDYWLGTRIMPELLASFVTPNHPSIAKIGRRAANFLEQWTGQSSLTAYQMRDPQQVRYQVAAIYEALRAEGINYVVSPPTFEVEGQRVRLSDRVLAEKQSNCLESTLLMAACLEAYGLHPILCLIEGHAFVGVWLVEDCADQMVSDDVSYLRKSLADGVSEMLFVEATCFTSATPVPFDDAVRQGYQRLLEGDFELWIDVFRCRLSQVRPLPQRVHAEGQIWVEDEGPLREVATQEVQSFDRYEFKFGQDNAPLTKQGLWERKLLDISLRNNLVNLKAGRRVLPLVSFNIDVLEDALADGEQVSILPSPLSKKTEPDGSGIYESVQYELEVGELVRNGLKQHRLYSYQTEAELNASLKQLYRSARLALEENGANSLFVSLGLLKWYEQEKSLVPRYAPLLLVPVDILRKGGNNYVIRTRDEDTIFNTTLLELLKQNFSISIDTTNTLTPDDHGIDVKKALAYVTQMVKGQKGWLVLEEAMLGLFSFNKFVMWNDIHTHADLLRENPVVKSLMDGRVQWEVKTSKVDARQLDQEHHPVDFALPIDVDSSQMEAVVEAGNGQSFILHGPPGTGKSQTITNLIANALYQGKRVLFVAEKMAALSVVQKRLQRIGLDPFCLELHSNKVTKQHFLEQMQQAIEVQRTASPASFREEADKLQQRRAELVGYVNALHTTRASGLSLQDCIAHYLQESGDAIEVSGARAAKFTLADVQTAREQLADLEAVFHLVGQPSAHPLRDFHLRDADPKAMQQLPQVIQRYLDALAALSKQLPLNQLAIGNWAEVVTANRRFIAQRRLLLQTMQPSALQQSAQALQAEWVEIEDKWFLPRYFARRAFVRKVRSFCLSATAESIPQTIQHLADFEQASAPLWQLLGVADPSRRAALDGALIQHSESLFALDEMAEINWPSDSYDVKIPDMLRRVVEHLSLLRNWSTWSVRRKQLMEGDWSDVVRDIERTERRPAELAGAFYKGCMKAMAQSIIDSDPGLQMFHGALFDQSVDKYRQLVRDFQELTKRELYCRLAARVPNLTIEAASSSEVGILKRNIANGGRGTSIRRIIDQIPTLLPKLCPCMLMSPMSVAQFIDLEGEKFDLVVFDEASQMPTSQAVGAIARGRSLVVVGDPKQMPPTSFFASANSDEELAEVEDMESILDDCIALSMPSRYLTWHYRSKHESLITFSNQQYYDARLFTFPSVDDRVSKVTLRPIDGHYDKGKTRCNRKEAEAIVDEVVRRLSDDELAKRSIGVVSFSQVQQNLIEDLLTDRLATMPQLEALAFGGEEPIFVKNLENVQGD
ncbi:MAG: DUF4011 domain-containing protein, partial [Bacteroidaceae bacterium]|nr:DUF4011 domain-containing protein [Bacteroidaceae bacterium]